MDRFENDERISAYLDGELTAEEQSQFDEQLAESAELRQLVEELRALRGSLDLLPRHRLEDDFAERVLHRAKREVLISGHPATFPLDTEPALAGPDVIGPRTSSTESTLDRFAQRPRRSLRPMIYAAVAIAAAVLIMIFDPTRPRDREVAEHNSRNAGRSALGEPGARPNASATSRRPTGNLADDVKASEVGSLQDLQVRDGGVDRSQNLGMKLDKAAKRSEKDALGGAELKESDASKSVANDRSLHDADKKSGGDGVQVETVRDSAEPKRAQGAAGNEPAGASRFGDNSDADRNQKSQTLGPESDSSTHSRFGGAGRAVPKDRPNAPPSGSVAAPGDALGKLESQVTEAPLGAATEALRSNSSLAADLLYVEFVTDGGQLAESTFGQLLDKHQIVWAEMANSSAPLAYYAVKNGLEGVSGKSARPDQGNLWSLPIDQLAKVRRFAWRDNEKPRTVGNEQTFEIVYVEGTRRQVQGLIDDLTDKRDVFQTVSQAAVPAKSLTTYLGYQPSALSLETTPDGKLQLGLAANRPELKQAESRAALHQDGLATEARTPAPPVQARATPTASSGVEAGAGASSAEKSARERNDGGVDRRKSVAPTDNPAAGKRSAAGSRSAPLPTDGKLSPGGSGFGPPLTAPAAPASAPGLDAFAAGDAPSEQKPAAERGFSQSNAVVQEELKHEPARSSGLAVLLRPLEQLGEAEKPIAGDSAKRAVDSPAGAAPQQHSVELHEWAYSAAKQDPAAFKGVATTPPASADATVTPKPGEKSASVQRSGTSNGQGGGRARDAVTKSTAEKGKVDLHRLESAAGTVTTADRTEGGPGRMRAVFVFRKAPQAAVEAGPAAERK